MSEPDRAEPAKQPKAEPLKKGTAPLPKRAPESPAKPALAKLRRALGELIAAHRAGSTHMVPVYAHNLRNTLDAAVKLRGVATDTERAELADIEPRAHKLLSRPTPTPATPTSGGDDVKGPGDLQIDWDVVSDSVDQIVPGVGPAVTKAPQVYRDVFEAVTRSPLHMSTVFKEQWELLKEHWLEFLATTAAFFAAEVAVFVLAASPEPVVTKIAAVVLQGLIAAFAIHAAVSLSEEGHAYTQAFWMNVEAANGDVRMLDAAALNFARLVVSMIKSIVATVGTAKLIQRALTTPVTATRTGDAKKPTAAQEQSRSTSQNGSKDSTGTAIAPSVTEFPVDRSQLRVATHRTPRVWKFTVDASLPDGRTARIGKGGVELDAAGVPRGGPDFTINKQTLSAGADGVVQVYERGVQVSLTDLVLDEALSAFKKEFGHSPDNLPGMLAWKNKLNFQTEYAKAIDAGLTHKAASQ